MTPFLSFLVLLAQGPNWSIAPEHRPVWDGRPYVPIGARISGTPESIAAAKAAGIEDVVVELPVSGAGWSEAFQALEKAKMRYLIDIDSAAPSAVGIGVEPAGYRIDDITEW